MRRIERVLKCFVFEAGPFQLFLKLLEVLALPTERLAGAAQFKIQPGELRVQTALFILLTAGHCLMNVGAPLLEHIKQAARLASLGIDKGFQRLVLTDH